MKIQRIQFKEPLVARGRIHRNVLKMVAYFMTPDQNERDWSLVQANQIINQFNTQLRQYNVDGWLDVTLTLPSGPITIDSKRIRDQDLNLLHTKIHFSGYLEIPDDENIFNHVDAGLISQIHVVVVQEK